MSSLIPVVENPRRRKRRRSRRLSRKQLAAGFGGKRRMSARRTTRRRARRNPPLALLANPRRRRRRRYSVPSRRRRYRRRSNPGFGLSGITNLLDIKTAGFVAGGVAAAKLGPGLISKVWPSVPRIGIAGHAVKLGTVLLSGIAVKYLFKSNQRAAQLVAGGVAVMLYDAFNEYVAPKLGLYGLGGYVTESELGPLLGGVNGYVPAPTYLDGPVSPNVPMEQMAM